jgi:hypothetical protein
VEKATALTAGSSRLFVIGVGHSVNYAALRRTAAAGRGPQPLFLAPADSKTRMLCAWYPSSRFLHSLQTAF